MTDREPPRMLRRSKQASDDPKMIGLWKIGRTIGKGSSGRVRIARHSKTGQYAAVKIVSKTTLLNSRLNMHIMGDLAERILAGIEREIVVMKLIDHPNIMRLYDVWETSSELYLILEYVEGGELFDYLCSEGKLSTSEGLNYFQQIIAAIDYCHRFNIAHRDLKPENILLDADKNIKIADFGMAVWLAGPNNGMLKTSCGSPHYAAPEVIRGIPYDGSKADIWSCGVILFALLSGQLPFDDENLDVLLDKVTFGKFDMPAEFDPMAKDLISKMLQKDYTKRITMSEIVKHPFYTSQTLKGDRTMAPSLDDISRPIGSIIDIDPDIFANLRTLWLGVPDAELTESLKNSEPSWQKGVYHLLVEYRAKHLENYDEDEEEMMKRLLSKRKNKKKALELTLSDSAELGASRTSIPARCDPPTPRRAGGSRRSDSTVMEVSSRPPPPQLTFHSPSPPSSQDNCRSPHLSPTPFSPTSPLSPVWDALNLPPLDVPEMQNDKIQEFFHQIVDHLNAMQVRTQSTGGTPNLEASPHLHPRYIRGLTNNSAAPPPTPLDGGFQDRPYQNGTQPGCNNDGSVTEREDDAQHLERHSDSSGLGISNNNGTKPLSVRRSRRPHPLNLTDKENEDSLDRSKRARGIIKKPSLSGPGERTIFGTRHVQILEPTEAQRSKLRKQRSFDPSSPAPSDDSAPRRSWFAGVFKFKPTRYELLSVHDAYTSREECRRLLVGLGARVVLTHAEGLGVLRCRLDEVRDPAGVMAVVRAVRFRVEVRHLSAAQAAAGYEVALQLVQEKGALSSFRSVYARLRREWDLDTPRTPANASPPLTAGGRFAETVYPS